MTDRTEVGARQQSASPNGRYSAPAGIDCVVGYHLNPMRCGVAKFNSLLAKRLGVPVVGLFDDALLAFGRPLVSLKLDEFVAGDAEALGPRLAQLERRQAIRLFLHNYSGTEVEEQMVRAAHQVYCGNSELAARLATVRPDVVELWAPGMIDGSRRFGPAEISVFSFGMAHKVRAEKYRKLRQLLEATGKSYSLYISTALHENSDFDDEFAAAFQELQEIFGERAHFLGYLSDLAVYNYLLNSAFFAAFFDGGVRGNNTSVNAALEYGCAVITNLDRYSPGFLVHAENVLDIERMETLPTDRSVLDALREGARETAAKELSWQALTKRFTEAAVPAPPEMLDYA